MMASHMPRKRINRSNNPYSRNEGNAQPTDEAELSKPTNDNIHIDDEEEESDWWQLADGVTRDPKSVCQDLAELTVQALVYTPFQAVTRMLPLRRTQQVIKHTVASATDTVTGAAQDVKSSEIWKTYTADPSASAKSTIRNKSHAKKNLLTNGTPAANSDTADKIDDTDAIGNVRVRVLSAHGIGTRETSIRVVIYSEGSVTNANNTKNTTPTSTGPSISFDKDEATFDLCVADIQSDVCLHIYQTNRISKDSCIGYVTIPVLHLASGRRHGLRGRFNVCPTTDGSRVRYVPVLRQGMGEEPRESPGYGYLNLEVQLQLGGAFRKSSIPILPLLHAYMKHPSPEHTSSDVVLGTSGSDRLLLNLQRCRNIGVRVFAPTGALFGACFAARSWSNPLFTLCVHVLLTYWCLYASTWQVPLLVFMYALFSGYAQSVLRASAAALGSTPGNRAGGTSVPAFGVYTPWRNVQREQFENEERRRERRRAIASTVVSTVNMTMKLQGKTLVGVLQTLQVVWLGMMLFTVHIVRRGAERLLPENTLNKLQQLAAPVVMLLPPAIRERVGVAATALDDYEMSNNHTDGVLGVVADTADIGSADVDAKNIRKEAVEEEEPNVVHHKLSMIQQLNKTVQQVDDAQQLIGSVASYSEKLLNALAFEDRNVSLVLYTLLFITASILSASIMATQLLWVFIAPMLMWPTTGEILCVVLNVAMLPLDRLLWVVPRSLREMVSSALADFNLGSGGGMPKLPEYLMLPEPVSNVLKRAPDEMEVAHKCIAKQMLERGDSAMDAAATADDQVGQ